MEAAERTEESEEDITAAETAPRPMKVTHLGNKKGCIIYSRQYAILQICRIQHMFV